GRERETVGIFAVRHQVDRAIGSDAVDRRAIPQVFRSGRTRYLAVLIGNALVGIGEIETAVGMADDVVGTVQSLAVVALGDGGELAVAAEARYPARVALAYHESSLQIERS